MSIPFPSIPNQTTVFRPVDPALLPRLYYSRIPIPSQAHADAIMLLLYSINDDLGVVAKRASLDVIIERELLRLLASLDIRKPKGKSVFCSTNLEHPIVKIQFVHGKSEQRSINIGFYQQLCRFKNGSYGHAVAVTRTPLPEEVIENHILFAALHLRELLHPRPTARGRQPKLTRCTLITPPPPPSTPTPIPANRIRNRRYSLPAYNFTNSPNSRVGIDASPVSGAGHPFDDSEYLDDPENLPDDVISDSELFISNSDRLSNKKKQQKPSPHRYNFDYSFTESDSDILNFKFVRRSKQTPSNPIIPTPPSPPLFTKSAPRADDLKKARAHKRSFRVVDSGPSSESSPTKYLFEGANKKSKISSTYESFLRSSDSTSSGSSVHTPIQFGSAAAIEVYKNFAAPSTSQRSEVGSEPSPDTLNSLYKKYSRSSAGSSGSSGSSNPSPTSLTSLYKKYAAPAKHDSQTSESLSSSDSSSPSSHSAKIDVDVKEEPVSASVSPTSTVNVSEFEVEVEVDVPAAAVSTTDSDIDDSDDSEIELISVDVVPEIKIEAHFFFGNGMEPLKRTLRSRRRNYILLADHSEITTRAGIVDTILWYLTDVGLWMRIGPHQRIRVLTEDGNVKSPVRFKYAHVDTPFDRAYASN